MAKVTITIEDGAEPGRIQVAMEFDPVIKQGDACTPAQQFAIEMMQATQENEDFQETSRTVEGPEA